MNSSLGPQVNQGIDHDGDTTAVLVTKLYRPPVPADVEPRADIVMRLEQNRDRPLTLIVAPAGYGKSTLASLWLESTSMPGVWVSVDEHDNDLRTFLAYLVTGMRNVHPEIDGKTLGLLNAPTLPPPEIVARYLLNDWAQLSVRTVVVLDDIHKLSNQAVFELLTNLLRHPSQTVHLVLISRRDPPLPIATMRGRRQLTEVRVRDLRFTSVEAAGLLSKLIQRPISDAMAAVWTERTEGWVTALHLAALSLRQGNQGDLFAAEPNLSNKYIEDYLLAEVLARLPDGKKRCLMMVSLFDRFCASLCDVICAPLPGEERIEPLPGEEFVAWLRDTNVFLIPLDDQGQWYRLHHLIQELLRKELLTQARPEETAELYRLASAWFRRHGLLDEAIRYAVAAEDWPAVEDIVIHHRHELMNTEQWYRLQDWMRLLPRAMIDASPYLTYISAYLELTISVDPQRLGHLAQAANRLSANLPDSDETRMLQGETAAIYSVACALCGDVEPAYAYAQQALQRLGHMPIYARAVATTVLSALLQMKGQYEDGVSLMHATLTELNWPERLRADLWNQLCIVTFLEGDMTATIRAAHASLRTTAAMPTLVRSQTVAWYFLGACYYLRNDLEQALAHFRNVTTNHGLASPGHMISSLIALALIHAARGEWTEAGQLIETSLAQHIQWQTAAIVSHVESFQLELLVRQGELDKARRRAAAVDQETRLPLWELYVPQLTPIKLLMLSGKPEDLATARTGLNALREQFSMIRRNAVLIETLALLAVVYNAQNDRRAADAALKEALQLAAPGSITRYFIELGAPMASLLTQFRQTHTDLAPAIATHMDRILRQFETPVRERSAVSSSGATPVAAQIDGSLSEPLTERELQVLVYLDSEASPAEIARELGIATSTTRSHIKSIYAKLAAHSRFEAVTRAQRLRLL